MLRFADKTEYAQCYYWMDSMLTGIDGNEMADKLAKVGTETLIKGPEPYYEVPKSVVPKTILERLDSESNHVWDKAHDLKQAKVLMKEFSRQKSTETLNPGWKQNADWPTDRLLSSRQACSQISPQRAQLLLILSWKRGNIRTGRISRDQDPISNLILCSGSCEHVQ